MKIKRHIACVVPFVAILLSCTVTANKDKPLIFFNRQPSDPSTSAIDHGTMNFSDKTFYVGFDAIKGGEIQGKMIVDYFANKTKKEADRNGDGEIGYVLAIGDVGHNDSRARTIGIRKALGTLIADPKENYMPGKGKTQVGKIKLKDGELPVREIASEMMTAKDGSGWNADAAKDAFSKWNNEIDHIDIAISNNDGMAGGMRTATNWKEEIPLFGYDANKDALEAISKGKMTGTITQNVDAQAAGVLQLIRNIIDGEKGENVVKKGFSEKDKWGNKITPTMNYVQEDKALMAENSAITKDNINDYLNEKRDEGIKDISKNDQVKAIKTWISLYNGSDNFLSSSYRPALEHYAKLMKINLQFKEGDGQKESSVLDKFVGLGNFDAYAVNMVATNSGPLYTKKIH